MPKIFDSSRVPPVAGSSAILAEKPASGQIWPVAIDVSSGGGATLRAFGSIHSVQLNRLIRSKEFIFETKVTLIIRNSFYIFIKFFSKIQIKTNIFRLLTNRNLGKTRQPS
jgi:hypothetical protein